MAIVHTFADSLRGAGDTKSPMLIAFVGPVFVRLSACWILAFELELGLIGIWLGSTLDWFVRSIWVTLIFKKEAWMSIDLFSSPTQK